ncbi:MAG TPA: GNAT family N-acetyltransferase [Atopostipes sp.]|nr:GNAT family N-acetyltransferase [Atopostipes sp.]
MEFIKGENRFYREDDDGNVIAEITYKPIDEATVDADHTFVDPSLRGQGVAEQLVDRLVKEMEDAGKKIKPTCPYVEKLFERKEEKYEHIAADK